MLMIPDPSSLCKGVGPQTTQQLAPIHETLPKMSYSVKVVNPKKSDFVITALPYRG